MTTIRLEGARVAFSGTIKGYTKSTLRALLDAQGATYEDRPVEGLDVFLVGDRAAYKKVDKAKALGIVILEGDALHALLEEGRVEFDDSVPTRPLDELVADARALFDGHPSREVWAGICALADECDDAQIEDFVAYLTPQLDAWPRVVDFEPNGPSDMPGHFADAAGEVRVMPSDWLSSMLHGEQHTKHRLATAITFSTLAVDSTLSMKLFDNPDLAHVRVLDIGANIRKNVKKTRFYRRMCECEYLGSLDTLMLARAPKGAFAALAKASSMPNLTRLVLRDNIVVGEADVAEVLTSVWAEALTEIYVSRPHLLEAVAEHRDALPGLEVFGFVDSSMYEVDDAAASASALSSILPGVARLVLSIGDSYRDPKGHVLGALLDTITGELEELDVRACHDIELAGLDGEEAARRYFVDSGLGARLGVLRVSEHVSREVCQSLRDEGVEVSSPYDEMPDAPLFSFVEEPAPGDAERAALGQVHPSDAVMFSEPNARAWRTLTSVVDGLERQLEPAAFEAAVDELEGRLVTWPSTLRVCPARWLGEVLSDSPSPKLRLARVAEVKSSHLDTKAAVRLWSKAVEVGNLSEINEIRLIPARKQKAFVECMASLFEHVRPSAYTIPDTGHGERVGFEKAMSKKGLLPESDIFDVGPELSWNESIAALEKREVSLELYGPSDLQRVLSRVDMDHVVSLDLVFDTRYGSEDEPGWGELVASPASWKSLRHLSVRTSNEPEGEVFDAVVTWLSAARPVQVDDFLQYGSFADSPSCALAKVGVYSRAHGSILRFPNEASLDEVAAVVGREDVRVSTVTVRHFPELDLPSTSELVDAMHPSLRATLTGLKWPIRPDEFDRVDASLAKLPALSYWSPVGPELATRKGRAPLLAAIAKSPEAARLTRISMAGSSSSTETPVSRELEKLAAGAFDETGWEISAF